MYVLNVYYVQGTVLGCGDTASCSIELVLNICMHLNAVVLLGKFFFEQNINLLFAYRWFSLGETLGE